MSTLDFRDLPSDRLSSTDEEGRRVWIIPARVRGVWKKRRNLFQAILLLIFVLTPWLRWKGAPVMLIDLAERQFIFFGSSFGAHDAPVLFFILGLLGFSLIVAAILWGRVWCGWACPQTVFIEQVFRRIETLVIGNRATQLASRKDPFKPKFLIKHIITWSLFTLISIFLAHTFISYFVSWEKLLSMMARPPAESWTVFLTVFFFSALILFDFAWFREQFCIIMCPYGRFQAVLLDEDSKTVAYDYVRGEKRGRGIKKTSSDQGDCIDCYKCVSVCPTGIDIRSGQQLECIACTACIDACDEVMEKVKRPKGLIRYASLNEIEGNAKKKNLRSYVYTMGIFLFFLGFVYNLSTHKSSYVSILRQNKKAYSVLEQENGKILINNFRMHLKNSNYKKVTYDVKLEKSVVTMAPPFMKGELEPNQSIYLPFFIQQRLSQWESGDGREVTVQVVFHKDSQDEVVEQVLKIVGPKE